MEILQRKNLFFLFFLIFFNFANVLADSGNVQEILKVIQKDLKTLEKAVYSENFSNESNNSISDNTSGKYSEDALTRHLLKLSAIEKQFQDLTNKFEEINFKLDKLSTRVSKIQADNQIRFQDIESDISSGNISNTENQLSLKPKIDEQKVLPGSSQPQD